MSGSYTSHRTFCFILIEQRLKSSWNLFAILLVFLISYGVFCWFFSPLFFCVILRREEIVKKKERMVENNLIMVLLSSKDRTFILHFITTKHSHVICWLYKFTLFFFYEIRNVYSCENWYLKREEKKNHDRGLRDSDRSFLW